MEPLLELQDIARSFGVHQVLKGISLKVYPGEFLTFLGPSGCGKTTTLRIIAGFERPDRGRVLLKGSDVTGRPPYARDVHTVFQHYALFPHYNVFENVAFSLKVDKVPEPELTRRVTEALDLVKLPGFERRRIDYLSGGQQQRVALARSLVGHPSLLLLDEPLGALDLKLRRQMQLELKGIQKKTGITFLYVTHDQEEALTLSDRIAVFNAGEIVQLGDPRSVYEAPRSGFVADFIGSANVLEAEIREASPTDVRLLLEGDLELRLPRPEGFDARSGEKVPVAVRPERVGVFFEEPPARGGGLLRLKASLREAVYLGPATQLIVSPFARSDKVLTAVTMEPVEAHLNGGIAGKGVWLEIRLSDFLLCRR